MQRFDPFEVYSLVTEAFGSFASPDISPIFTQEYYLEHVEKGIFLGDTEDGKLVSFLHLVHCQGNVRSMFKDPVHPCYKELESFFMIVALSVKPGCQGRGLGYRLVERAEELVKSDYTALGSEIRAGVARSISPSSYRLFLKRGYEPYHETSVSGWGLGSYFRKVFE